MKLTTAVVDVAVKISNNLKETDWENMNKRHQELDDKVRQMRRVVANMFESVFIYRFKDVCPEIRSICMEEMGYWFQKLPQDFLDDDCLRYVGKVIFFPLAISKHLELKKVQSHLTYFYFIKSK